MSTATYQPGSDWSSLLGPLTDATGTLANPTSLTLTVYQNGTSTSQTMTSSNRSTGYYDLSWTVPNTGFADGDLIRIEADADDDIIVVDQFVLDATVASRSTFDASSDNVTVGTNNDKAGYSISGTKTTLDDLNDFDPASDEVAHVTLVDTTTTNTDMRGTDSAAMASSWTSTLATALGKLGFDASNNVKSAPQTDVTLAADGLDNIPVSAPTGPATTFAQMIVQTWRRYFAKSVYDASGNTLKTYADDGTTVVTTQTATNASGVYTQGKAT